MHYYETLMRECFDLTKQAEGTASPNPLVGSVVMKDGMIVGRGIHRGPGQMHAEPMAIAEAGEKAKGATLVVNLEPCCHWGRQPPCAPIIAEAGLQRVVAAYVDPDPRVLGGGFKYLREHGVEVVVGVLEVEARWLNRSFNKHAVTKVPWVTMKAALSLDGRIALRNGVSKWLSSESSRAEVQRLRYRSDAIMVGRGTIEADNPQLTVRTPGLDWKKPVKVILDGRLKLNPMYAVFSSSPSLLVTVGHANDRMKSAFEKHPVEVLEHPDSKDSIVPLEWLLKELGQRGVARLMVEGGQHVFSQFLAQGLVDEAVFYYSPKILGDDSKPLVGNLGLTRIEDSSSMRIKDVSKVGEDIRVEAVFVHGNR
ncbi:MAG: bifunctional diaminohydroxyphosphoribosylaminopyrimidine deaminase/5-amino-6-(5-phosphoribosylamino)uracil reductase RibD [bacterium]